MTFFLCSSSTVFIFAILFYKYNEAVDPVYPPTLDATGECTNGPMCAVSCEEFSCKVPIRQRLRIKHLLKTDHFGAAEGHVVLQRCLPSTGCCEDEKHCGVANTTEYCVKFTYKKNNEIDITHIKFMHIRDHTECSCQEGELEKDELKEEYSMFDSCESATNAARGVKKQTNTENPSHSKNENIKRK